MCSSSCIYDRYVFANAFTSVAHVRARARENRTLDRERRKITRQVDTLYCLTTHGIESVSAIKSTLTNIIISFSFFLRLPAVSGVTH